MSVTTVRVSERDGGIPFLAGARFVLPPAALDLGAGDVFPHSVCSFQDWRKFEESLAGHFCKVSFCEIVCNPLTKNKNLTISFELKKKKKRKKTIKPHNFGIKSWNDLTWVKMPRNLVILPRIWSWKLFFICGVCQYPVLRVPSEDS